MAHYRDELEAARARIETLEARIREREASLEARDAELAELRGELERARRSQGGAFVPALDDPPSRPRAVLVALAACAFMTTAAYAVMRPARCSMDARSMRMPRAAVPVEVQLTPLSPPSRVEIDAPPRAASTGRRGLVRGAPIVVEDPACSIPAGLTSKP